VTKKKSENQRKEGSKMEPMPLLWHKITGGNVDMWGFTHAKRERKIKEDVKRIVSDLRIRFD
jgi:hypothetical protein